MTKNATTINPTMKMQQQQTQQYKFNKQQTQQPKK